MHTYRSAARTAAWFDNGRSGFNPFSKFRSGQQDRYAVYNVSDDEALGTVWAGPTQTVSETNLTTATNNDIVPARRNNTAPSIAPSDELFPSKDTRHTLAARLLRPKADSKENVENEEAPHEKLDVDPQDTVTTHARPLRSIFRRNKHGLLKEEHTHIGQKVGEIGGSIAAYGNPSANLAADPAGDRNALVIDFEKDVGRAKGDRKSTHLDIQLINSPLDSSSTNTKSNGGPRLYQCSHAKTLFSGLALLHHPSIVGTGRTSTDLKLIVIRHHLTTRYIYESCLSTHSPITSPTNKPQSR